MLFLALRESSPDAAGRMDEKESETAHGRYVALVEKQLRRTGIAAPQQAVLRDGHDGEAAPILVRICLAINIADDEYHPDEKARIGEICGALGLDPAELET